MDRAGFQNRRSRESVLELAGIALGLGRRAVREVNWKAASAYLAEAAGIIQWSENSNIEFSEADLRLAGERILAGEPQDIAKFFNETFDSRIEAEEFELFKAQLCIGEGDPAGALDYFNRVDRKASEFRWQWLAVQGRACLEQGRVTDARAAFDEAIQIAPKRHELHRGLGDVYLYDGRFTDAIVVYEEAVRLNPKDGDAYYGMGQAWLAENRVEKAIQALTKAAELLGENHVEVAFALGRAYTQQGDRDTAANWLRGAKARLRFDDSDSHIALEIGDTFYTIGDYQSAVEIYQDLDTQERGNPELWEKLAMCYDALGDSERAAFYRQRLQGSETPSEMAEE